MKKVLIAFFAFSLLVSAQKLTLEKSLEIGLQRSEEVKISEIKKKIANYKSKEIFARFFPQFDVNLSYARLSDVPPFEISVPFFPKPVKIQETYLNYYNISAGFRLPLFLGFKLTSLLAAAEKNIAAEKINFEKAQNKKALEIITAFWNFRKANLKIQLLEKTLKRMNVHLNEVKSLLKNGRATENDLLKIKLKVSNLKVKYEEAKNLRKIAQMAFNKSIGKNLEAETEIETREISPSSENINLDALLQEGLKNSPDLKVTQKKLQAAEENVRAVNSDFYPTVSLFGNYYYNRPNQRYLPLKDEFNYSWDAGVNLRWTLWDGGERNAKSAIAEHELQINKLKLNTLKKLVKAKIISEYIQLKNTLTKIDGFAVAVKSAKENLRVVSKMFKEGTVNAGELIDAETELLNAKINYKTALIDYEIARVNLLEAVGRKIY